METATTRALTEPLSERAAFFVKSGLFLFLGGAILYIALAAEYPAVHDTLHNVRHALAIVPCH
jgi:cobalt transporter subunit CbtB